MWTLLIALALWWNTAHIHRTVRDMARAGARSSFDMNLLYRQWVARHGGVYVPVTDKTPPNPYLAHIPERDITTPSGRPLTLMNPAYATRQMHELDKELHERRSHITSLKPIRPENAPDDWERRALEAFERGVAEVSSVESVEGQSHLRLMRPLKTEADCLKCHAAQGYKEGDIRGGISVSVPLKDGEALVQSYQRTEQLVHGGIWAVGLMAFGVGVWQIQRRRRERDQAEASLRRSEEQLAQAQAVAHLGSWHLDVPNNVLEWSRETYRIFGVPEATRLTYDVFLSCVHPEDREYVDRSWKAALTGAPYDAEHRILVNGEVRWVREQARFEFDPKGNCRIAIGTVHDTTERKQAELALKAASQRFVDLVNTTDGIVWEADATTFNFTFVSERAERLLGYPLADWQRPGFWVEHLHPEDREGAIQYCLTCTKELKPHDIEYRFMAKDGRAVWLHDIVTVLAEDAKPRWLRGLMVDITERKLAEAELARYREHLEQLVGERTAKLEESRRAALSMMQDANELRRRAEQATDQLRLRTRAVEQSPVSVVITDTEGRIEYVNPHFAKVTGYTAAEAVGQNPRILQVKDAYPPEVYAGLWRAIKAGETWQGEFCNRKKNGDLYYEQASISPVRDEAGEITHFLAVKEDITERKRAGEDLRRAKEAAEAANKAKSAFLANMSHEIRTPMNAILGFSQLMQRDAGLTGKQRERLETINRAGGHLLSLINDVLEMSKIEAGRTTLNPAMFDLHGLLDDLGKMFRMRTEHKGLAFELSLDHDVPLFVVTDPGKLRQALTNLLGNAVKFTERGEVILRASAQPAAGGGASKGARLVFEVRDTGPGIGADELGNLFKYFSQTASGAKAEGGTGLGLAISREFARLMGGEITVKSTPGEGSTFRMEIDVRIGEAGDLPQAVPDRQVKALKPGHSDYRVLVVDDKETNRRLAAEVLGGVGFTVSVAENGQEALDAFGREFFDLVLMDRRMPVMDGLEAIRRIREMPRGKETRIIVLSASAFRENRPPAIEAGADEFMSKPFVEGELFSTIGRLIGAEYEYFEDDAATGDAAGTWTALTRESLSAVPADLRAQMLGAVVSADLDRLNALIDRVVPHDAQVAAGLRDLADRFEYVKLTGLLGGGDDGSDASAHI